MAGGADSEDTHALLDAVHGPYVPDKVVLVVDPSDPADMAFWQVRAQARRRARAGVEAIASACMWAHRCVACACISLRR